MKISKWTFNKRKNINSKMNIQKKGGARRKYQNMQPKRKKKKNNIKCVAKTGKNENSKMRSQKGED